MELDITRLNRDYSAKPLGLREHLTYNEIYYLYIELNWCNKKINTFLGKNPKSSWAIREAERHGIVKTKEQQNASMEQYYLETIGVKNPALKPGAMDKMKQTMKEKYGVENIAHRPETIDKRKKTCLDKYGVDNPAKVEEFKDKAVQTSLEKYGVEHAAQNKVIHQKQKDTMMERYGVEYPYQSKEIMDKYRNTSIEKYGVDNIMKCDYGKNKYIDSVLNLFGVDNIMKCEQVKTNWVNTIYERYGTDNPLKVPEIHAKMKQTMLEIYGAENASQVEELQDKKHQTMKENGTYKQIMTKPEKEIFRLLSEKYKGVEFNYKEERYPHRCDFYIPKLDLFIEYQGHPSHGKHPYNPNSQKDKDILDRLWLKAIDKIMWTDNPDTAYLGYIQTWTITDPQKRLDAKNNKLNWIEFFTMKQFKDWYKSI